MMKVSSRSSDNLDTSNFLRYLTLAMPGGIEDALLTPLFRPLSNEEVKVHIKCYTAKPFPFDAPHKMHLYIHIPFCAPACSYCHCSRIHLKDRQELSAHVDLIINQIRDFSPLFKKTKFSAFSLLGGTASLLSSSEIQRLFKETRIQFSFQNNALSQFEGHPISLSEDKLNLLKHCGVNRINLGIQSLDKYVLEKIDRKQTTKDVERCIKTIKKLKFGCLNTDLIAGLPGQTVTSFLKDIKTLVRWGVDLVHINPFSNIVTSSCYRKDPINLTTLLSRRHEMILKAKILLEMYGYTNHTSEGYQKQERLDDPKHQKLLPDRYPGAVLGLGIFARSNFPGKLVFENLPCDDSFAACRYVGHQIDQRYTMAHYAILHMLDGLDLNTFHRLFGKKFTDVFRKELRILNKEHMISSDNKTCQYCGHWTMPGLFNYFSHSKILFGDRMLSEFRSFYSRKYNPKYDYASAKSLTTIFQDLWCARTYYRVGYKSCWL